MKMKEYREALGLTQFELGKLLEIDSNSVSRIERSGKCNLEMAYKISLILGKSIEEIFFDEYKKR